jgi:hypothetical protein
MTSEVVSASMAAVVDTSDGDVGAGRDPSLRPLKNNEGKKRVT